MINRVPKRVLAGVRMEMGTGRRNQKGRAERRGIHIIVSTKGLNWPRINAMTGKRRQMRKKRERKRKKKGGNWSAYLLNSQYNRLALSNPAVREHMMLGWN